MPCAARRINKPEQLNMSAWLGSVFTGILGILMSLLLLWLLPAHSARRSMYEVGLISSVLSLLCFFATTWIPPGKVDTSDPLMRRRYLAALEHAAGVVASDSEKPPNSRRGTWWGETSPLIHQLGVVGPPRSKYCHATRQCVPVFDHYCAFFRMPIGRDNYGVFVLTLVTTAATSICIMLNALHLLQDHTTSDEHLFIEFVGAYFGAFGLTWWILVLTQMIQCYWGVTTYELMQAERRYPGYLLDKETGELNNPYQIGCLRTAWGRICPRFGIVGGGFGFDDDNDCQ